VTGEATGVRERAELMDEGIDLLRLLWSGVGHHEGRHYRYECGMDDQVEVGRPVQRQIPIWVVGVWHRPKSMARVLRCDGVVPQYADGDETPAAAREVRVWLTERGAPPDLDVIAQGETPADPAAAATEVGPWAEAGCTWWLETRWELPHHAPERMQQVRDRSLRGRQDQPVEADPRQGRQVAPQQRSRLNDLQSATELSRQLRGGDECGCGGEAAFRA
jgi:hypothetical protein